MTALKSLSTQFVAVGTAVALTLGLFNATLTVPQSQLNAKTTFVGEVA